MTIMHGSACARQDVACSRDSRAQQLARHASIQTTADIYGHLDDVDLEQALARMESLSHDRGQLFRSPPTIPIACGGKAHH
jgi:hypothetical protein